MFLERWAKLIERWARPASGVLSAIGAAFLCFFMFWVVLDVALRFLFNRPIIGTFEIVEYGMAFFVFLTFAFAQFNKSHIAVPVVVEMLNPRMRAGIDVITGVAMLLVLGLLMWAQVLQTQNMVNTKIVSSALFVPKWPFQAVAAIGYLAFFAAKVADVLDRLAFALGVTGAQMDEAEELRVM